MRRLMCTVSVFAAFACTEPQTALVGRFGGRLIELSANSTSAQFRLACGQITTGALRQDATGAAHASGLAVFEGAGAQPVRADVEVRMIESYHLGVVVSLPSGYSEAFELWRNTQGDFSGVGCVA